MLLPSAVVRVSPPAPTEAVTPPSCEDTWLICAAMDDVLMVLLTVTAPNTATPLIDRLYVPAPPALGTPPKPPSVTLFLALPPQPPPPPPFNAPPFPHAS